MKKISIKFQHGKLDEATLRKIAAVMKNYNLPLAKITGGKGITLAGVKDKQYNAICQELGLSPEQDTRVKCMIQGCSGNQGCTKGLADARWLAAELEKSLAQLSPPGKLKIAVSGCPHCCMQSMVRDVGFIARENGWTVTAGGMTGGIKPRKADIIAEGLEPQQAVALAKKIIQIYIAEGRRRERIGKMMERLGVSYFKKLVNDN